MMPMLMKIEKRLRPVRNRHNIPQLRLGHHFLPSLNSLPEKQQRLLELPRDCHRWLPSLPKDRSLTRLRLNPLRVTTVTISSIICTGVPQVSLNKLHKLQRLSSRSAIRLKRLVVHRRMMDFLRSHKPLDSNHKRPISHSLAASRLQPMTTLRITRRTVKRTLIRIIMALTGHKTKCHKKQPRTNIEARTPSPRQEQTM